jgi:hypothetical protein
MSRTQQGPVAGEIALNEPELQFGHCEEHWE